MITSTSAVTTTSDVAGGATATAATTPAATLSPAFFGWTSIGVQSGTTVYSSANCAQGYTFHVSDTFATCCASGAHDCTIYTGCGQGNVIIGSQTSSLCGIGAVCKTGVIHAGQPDATSQVIFCTSAGDNNYDFYRALPTPGLVSSGNGNTNSNPLASGGGSIVLGAGAITGVVFAIIVLLIGCCGCVYVLRRCSRGGGHYSAPGHVPMTAAEQRRHNRKETRNTDRENAERYRQDQIELNKSLELAARLGNN